MSESRIFVLGSGRGRRFDAFADAAKRAGRGNVIPVVYGQHFVPAPGDWLRFDSPDESAQAMRAVHAAGEQKAREHGFCALNPQNGASAQLAYGLLALQQNAVQPGVHLSATPQEVMLCYDKTACASHLKAHGIPVPQVFATPPSFQALLALLRVERRVFVKQRFGAGAAGTMALMAGPEGQVMAYTTIAQQEGGLRFVKRVQKISDLQCLRAMYDLLLPMGVHVERWVPKAGVRGRTCDLRVVAVRGAPPFCVLRLARGPITNLHLDAERAGADALFDLMKSPHIDALWETVRKVQAAFPNSLTVAPDIAITNDLRRHFVLEVNAFGDHIRRITIGGRTPQDWQVAQMRGGVWDAA